MKFTAAAFLLAAVASATTVSYDEGYDDAGRSLTAVSCSDGDSGLITKGYSTQGSVPGFPNIGGSWEIAGWGSPQCGACYTVTFEGRSINVVGVDRAADGLNLSKAALNTLTGGRAVEKGRVDATVTRVDSGVCGLRASKRTIEFMA
ncbi:Putative cerato-platanin, RlpA-like domain superfamily [Septoria linicola]|uniref:Cerato-platanin, RlpA-like domain superfamily n=1 Tax=Septoria linicola TaxID=215465 RepID=A0A9Q9ALN4_9PEZI|nr:putative cerato-platanin, RlpA-like domain superfamily [Septoria linicola]USW49253.1 Putative cerato-platanin, RlpA-like domain superfamily [Septoria linicola]